MQSSDSRNAIKKALAPIDGTLPELESHAKALMRKLLTVDYSS